jgi:hypothetical protein
MPGLPPGPAARRGSPVRQFRPAGRVLEAASHRGRQRDAWRHRSGLSLSGLLRPYAERHAGRSGDAAAVVPGEPFQGQLDAYGYSGG